LKLIYLKHSILNKMKQNNLAEVMDKENISQTDLAKKVKASIVTVNNIYNQKQEPKVYLAILIARVLKCTVEELFILLIIILFSITIFGTIKFEQTQESQRTNFSWVINEKNAKSAAENGFSWQVKHTK